MRSAVLAVSSRLLRAAALVLVGAGLLPPADVAAAEIVFVDGAVLVHGAPALPAGKAWDDVFRVTVADAGGEVPALAGKTAMEENGVLAFRPSFPFFPGVRYRAEFHLPGGEVTAAYHTASRPGGQPVPPRLVEVFPSTSSLPQNQLKFYLHFSKPMARGYAGEHVRLLAADGEEVDAPFLELDEELWDGEGRRLTLFLDPGRVKRGLKPHEDAGPSLVADREYSLEIRPGWKDADGVSLEDGFRKGFRTTGADYKQPHPDGWKIVAPEKGSLTPLVVMLGESLDHALLRRVVDVRHAGGGGWVEGVPRVAEEETRWEFVPDAPWREGGYQLVVGTELEDLAGNSVRKPFEVSPVNPGTIVPEAAVVVPFSVGVPVSSGTGPDVPVRAGWPQWRGPSGDSHARFSQGLPVRWDGRSGAGVAWRRQLPGDGASTPVVWGERVFLTSQIGTGPVAAYRGNPTPGEKEVTFLVRCLDVENGDLIWEEQVRSMGDLEAVHPLQNLATPSCVTDGQRVVAWFGTGQLLCYSLDGKELWRRHLGEYLHPFRLRWGHSSSPVLHGDSLFLLCDHDPAACLLALDVRDGDELWRVDHGRGLRSYSSPVVTEIGGREQVIVNSNPGIFAYDVKTGEKLWNWTEFCKVPVPLPTVHDGVLYASRGYTNGPLMAIAAEKLSGEVRKEDVHWRWASRAPYVSSPLYLDGQLFLSDERGRVFVVDAPSGEIVWTEKLGDKFWSSPVGGDGKVYFLAESGETIVISAGREPGVLARNALPGSARGSIAVAGNRLLLRTEGTLWCIQQ